MIQPWFVEFMLKNNPFHNYNLTNLFTGRNTQQTWFNQISSSMDRVISTQWKILEKNWKRENKFRFILKKISSKEYKNLLDGSTKI